MVTPLKPTPKTVDTTGWITAQQAVDMLGVCLATIYGWSRAGMVRWEYATRGTSMRQVKVYSPDELARMPRKFKQLPANEAGELTARVFELLNDGKTVLEIVIQTRETVDKIADLRERWLDSGGADLVITAAAKADLERCIGPFKTVGQLVELAAERFQIVATVPDDTDDAQVEGAIVAALDAEAAHL